MIGQFTQVSQHTYAAMNRAPVQRIEVFWRARVAEPCWDITKLNALHHDETSCLCALLCRQVQPVKQQAMRGAAVREAEQCPVAIERYCANSVERMRCLCVVLSGHDRTRKSVWCPGSESNRRPAAYLAEPSMRMGRIINPLLYRSELPGRDAIRHFACPSYEED